MSSDQWLITASIAVPLFIALVLYATRKWVQDIVIDQNTVVVENEKIPVKDIIMKIHMTLSQNNGGSSVKDSLDGLTEEMATLSGKFDQHIVEHGNTPAPRRLRASK